MLFALHVNGEGRRVVSEHLLVGGVGGNDQTSHTQQIQNLQTRPVAGKVAAHESTVEAFRGEINEIDGEN
jgi:hypothetical protein